MDIKSKYIDRNGIEISVLYSEADPLIGSNKDKLSSVHAFCFCGGKLVLVNHPKSGWIPLGGGIEYGESYEQASVREVKEETNMKVLYQELIGYSDVSSMEKVVRHARVFCIVEPYGEFASDPDGEILEIKLIDPKEYKKYFDWGEIGDRIMELSLKKLSAHNFEKR